MSLNIDDLREWIGKTQEDEEVLTPSLVRKFNATFDREAETQAGDIAPLLIHFCLTAPVTPESGLGPDGHPARGGFLPPVPLPRRMWAGGAFEFHSDIRIGETVQRKSTISNVELKQGRTGPLYFVTVEHEISSDGRAVLSERQDIVYREAEVRGQGAAKPEPEPAAAGQHRKQIEPTASLLFRYSALTFNGHRIHYDKPYAMGVEGYPGLIVHGPMQATLLCQMAADLRGRAPRAFSFRSLSAIYDDADFELHADDAGEEMVLWTSRVGGPVAMKAQARW